LLKKLAKSVSRSTSPAGRSAPSTCVSGVRLIAPVTGFRCDMTVTTAEPAAACIAL